MIIAIDPVLDLGPSGIHLCEVNQYVDHSAAAAMTVRYQLDIGVVELAMCGNCVSEALQNQQGGEGIAFLRPPGPACKCCADNGCECDS